MEGIITLVLDWIRKGASRSAHDERGRKVLCYGKELKIVGSALTIFWVVMTGLVILGVFKGSKEEIMWVAALFVFLAFIGIATLIEGYFVKVVYDETAVISYSPWRRDVRMIPWSDIESVRYSKIMQWYVCKTRNKGNVIVSSYLMGLNDFLDELEVRLNPI